MDALTKVLRTLCDPTRRAVLDLLRHQSRSVTELSNHFSMSRPAVSKHLGVLRGAGLVTARKAGRQQIYELNATALTPAHEWLESYQPESDQSGREESPTETPRARPVEKPGWKVW